MQHAFGIIARGVDGAVNSKSRRIYRERIGGIELVAGEIYFHQA